MLLREIKNVFHLELDSLYPKEEVDSFFYLLIEHFLNLERFILALRPDLILSKEEEKPLFEALAQLKLNRPVQYILGKTTFMDFDLCVDEHVLIPRPETEELVRWIIERYGEEIDMQGQSKNRRGANLNILDIGTGSGCIAIALAKNLPAAKVFALDISESVLEVAKKNADINEVEIKFVQGDILKLKPFNCIQKDLKYDIIVSNPPYVRDLEMKEMSRNVLDHEPSLALFVRDENPLRFYKSIVRFAQKHLNSEGLLYFEVNQHLGEETRRLLEANNFQDIELRKDIFGNYRMLRGKLSC